MQHLDCYLILLQYNTIKTRSIEPELIIERLLDFNKVTIELLCCDQIITKIIN